jgi:hypothetical protein
MKLNEWGWVGGWGVELASNHYMQEKGRKVIDMQEGIKNQPKLSKLIKTLLRQVS